MALDIVEELRQDREKGAKRLESEYKAGLMTLAMRFCSSQSDAEELVNRTFAAVVAGIDDYLEQSAFFGWMCQILKNLHSLDMRRKSNRCEVCTGDVPETADDDAQEAIYRSLDRSIVRAAIETLEPEEKEALLLHYFMDIPIKRMAKILAAPEGTVKRRLHFARKALAAKLGVAAKKSGVKAMLAILALCALTAIGAGLWRIGVAMFGTDDTAAIQQGNSSMESGVLEPDITSPLNADSVIPVSSVQSQGSDSVDNSQSAIPSSSTNQVPTRQEKSAMKKSSFLSAVLGTMFATGTVAQTAGSTVAWWHFDEEEPGTTATAAIAASGTSAPLSATPVSFSGATATASSGDWLPIYAKPFQGLAVYDPVTDTTRTNRAAMKFQTAESGKCGGALHAVTKSSDIYGSTANAITVEAFVCTTGGVFSTFAPIVACMQYENWTSEKWAIYEETDGTLALRFDGTPYYSGNSGQAGTAKINDGAWHHVAFTWDGSTVKIFVDYEQDKFKGSGNARQFTKTTTLGYNYGGQWDYTRIGGYKGQENETTVWRRFNGLVDEVRVSNVALTPDKFLRMQPLDMDGARSAPMSTGGSPTAGRTSTPAPHRTSCRFSSAADTKATPDGSPSSSSTAGSTIYV